MSTLMIAQTASQSSEMWKVVPISLNCPMLRVVEAPSQSPLDIQTAADQAPAAQPIQRKTNADQIADEIHAAVENAGKVIGTDPKPTNAAIAAATKLLAVVPDSLLGEPDVDVFYGEVHLQWSKGNREIVLMTFSSDKEPLVHHYERIKGAASKHAIEKADGKSLTQWLRWLNG